MNRILLVLFMVVSGLVQAQNSIEGTILRFGGNKVFLLSILGEKATKIDSAVTDQEGHFLFRLTGRLPGMYRVQWNKDGSVDLIWNHEDVNFLTTSKNPEDSLKIISSIENQINQACTRLDRISQSKLQLLMPVVDFYPVRDDFYASVAKELEKTQRSQRDHLDSLAKLYPDAFAVRIAKIYLTPFIPSGLNKDERISFLKQHYFENINFSDTALLRSMVFANKAIAYMSLYSNNRLPQKQLEAEFIRAVTIML